MSKLNIVGVVGGNFSSFTVDGVKGYFTSVVRNGFCKIQHRFDGAPGGYVLVANVSNGTTGEGGLRPMANDQKQADIMSKLENYVAKLNA
jgi:hypothetical protein